MSLNGTQLKAYCVQQLQRYWLDHVDSVMVLPVNENVPDAVALPVTLTAISLPEWACQYGVNQQLLVPSECCPNSAAHWQDINWWYVIYWYLTCQAEQHYERQHGPVHSYSYHYKNWDHRMWQHAWVNRIALFLRAWCIKHNNLTEQQFSPLPDTEIWLTHDLDAVRKTLAIRYKQSAFNMFNGCKALFKGQLTLAWFKFLKAIQILFRAGDYDHVERLAESVQCRQLSRRLINVYGGANNKKSFTTRIYDPDYDIGDNKITETLRKLMTQGFEIGVHPSVRAWNDADLMQQERLYIESALDTSIMSCRQHWLKFSFSDSWQSMFKAGIKQDSTLGFNDRFGFRNGAALCFTPMVAQTPLNGFQSAPLVLMDSHLYDYAALDEQQRKNAMDGILEELQQTKGIATILWHPHTFSDDYQWYPGFKYLLQTISGMKGKT